MDVNARYPRKELILQDFMDVEYMLLETTDDWVTTASIQTLGKEVMIVKNFNRNFFTDGDLFVFDRNGKGVQKLNRLGQGVGEYTSILGIVLDEESGEIFVNSHFSGRVLVYDLSWNFKRSFGYEEEIFYERIINFDQSHLICHICSHNEDDIKRNRFRIISKQDGSVSKEIHIPYEKKKKPALLIRDLNGEIIFDSPARNQELIPYYGSYLLVEPASDTIYRYAPDHTMAPFIVRTPSIQSMDPEVYLFPGVLTDRYYFLQTVALKADMTTKSLPRTDLVYDKQEKAIYEYTVYNDDFTNKNVVKLGYEAMVLTLVNDEVAFIRRLEAHTLVEAYEKGELKGRLKEIAAQLDEESNPVIMLAKYRK
ncbi:MAG: 6-bladed beta-propeller [Tannerellaceae bacterium]|nr:6-bladed beta-propeller [Tannerellaceae bacterium]